MNKILNKTNLTIIFIVFMSTFAITLGLLHSHWFLANYTLIYSILNTIIGILGLPAIIGCFYILEILNSNKNPIKSALFVFSTIICLIPTAMSITMDFKTTKVPVVSKWETIETGWSLIDKGDKWKTEKHDWSLTYKGNECAPYDFIRSWYMDLNNSKYNISTDTILNSEQIRDIKQAQKTYFELKTNNKKSKVTLNNKNIKVIGDFGDATVTEMKVQHYTKVNKVINGKVVDTENESGNNLALTITYKYKD